MSIRAPKSNAHHGDAQNSNDLPRSGSPASYRSEYLNIRTSGCDISTDRKQPNLQSERWYQKNQKGRSSLLGNLLNAHCVNALYGSRLSRENIKPDDAFNGAEVDLQDNHCLAVLLKNCRRSVDQLKTNFNFWWKIKTLEKVSRRVILTKIWWKVLV